MPSAWREIVAELMDIPPVNRYFTELLSGVNLRYELPYPAADPAGRYCADLELVDDDGAVSRLHEHTQTGRWLLLLTPGTRELAACATGRADVVPVTNTDPLLIRPDGVVAWAQCDRASLDTALDSWIGPIRRAREVGTHIRHPHVTMGH